jgi:hypothetical protein
MMMMMIMMVVRLLLHLGGGKGVDLGALLHVAFSPAFHTHISFFFFLFFFFILVFYFGHEAKHLDKIMFVLTAPVFGHIALMTLLLLSDLNGMITLLGN